MKLIGQASQYWTNFENRCRVRGHQLIDTWDRMKEDLKTKYVSPSFSDRLMNKWHQYTQGNKSEKKYVTKFDEFLTRYSTINKDKLKFFLDLEPDLEKTYLNS